jgi:hypothetical protein
MATCLELSWWLSNQENTSTQDGTMWPSLYRTLACNAYHREKLVITYTKSKILQTERVFFLLGISGIDYQQCLIKKTHFWWQEWTIDVWRAI